MTFMNRKTAFRTEQHPHSYPLDSLKNRIPSKALNWIRICTGLLIGAFSAGIPSADAHPFDEKTPTAVGEESRSFGESLIGSPFPSTSVVVPEQNESPETATVVRPAGLQEVADDTLTPEVVSSRKVQAEQTPELSAETRAQIARHFQGAMDLLAQKAEAQKKTVEWKSDKETGPTQIAEIRAKLAAPLPPPEPVYPEHASVAELDVLRLADEEKANEAARNLEAWELKAKLRMERKPQMPALIDTTHQQLEKAQTALAAPAAEGELPVVIVARQTEQQALVELLRAQLELMRTEQIRYESLSELFPLQRDLLARTRNGAEKRAEAWKTILAEARRQDSERQAIEAKESLRNAHPTLRDLATKNSLLTTRRNELQEFIATSVKSLSEVHNSLTAIDKKFKGITDKESRTGLTTAIGLLLRNQRIHLPDVSTYRLQQYSAEQDIIRLQTEQMQLEDERSDLGDIQSQVDETLELIAPNESASPELRQMTLELLSDRRKYLDNLIADYESCVQTLSETDSACRRLESMVVDYERYIDERIFWIRSAPAVEPAFFARSFRMLQAILLHKEWGPLTEFLFADAQSNLLLYGLCTVGFLTFLALRRKARKLISQLAEMSSKQIDAGIRLTLFATVLATVMAAILPLLMWFVSWRISQSELNLAVSFSHAMSYSAGAFWIVNTFRQMCRRNGVAELFLEWPQSIVRNVHSNLLIYLTGGIPLSILVIATGSLDGGVGSDSAGRLAFLCLCLLLAITLRRVVRPTIPAISDLLRSSPASVMYRLRWVWYTVAVGAPLSLAVLALMGYQYTAEQLMIRIQWTLCLSIVLLIAYTIVMQWMLAAKRSLALKQARLRRTAAVAAAQREAEEGGAATSPIPPVETPLINLSLLNQQMLQLVRGTACILFLTVCWGIWGPVLPALKVFSRIELWQVKVESVPLAESTGPATTIAGPVTVESITLGSLMLAMVVLSGAVLASRNLPGLLELAVLQRLPMDHGGRNAITTVSRYVLIFAGIVIACNSIGISWGSVQWLAAALTVGLGFGLQEIFANFISGLLILFERPIRIGDIVTIDGISGCVSRIQMRATTITDWDRKEYIVPNKEFVTSKVLNWTLSDKVNRVVVNVGVAYGTNTEAALMLMQSIADNHPVILQDPPPVVSFEGFGDSCLNLVLRCYLPNLDHRLKVTSDLHSMIHQQFSDHGIVIPFPQRELHIRPDAENLNAASAADFRQRPGTTANSEGKRADSKRAS